ncbi:MAG: extracellular solute-binding protein [Lachnospiraceae bacterium]|nr:extracellular solute-binding protein [Lachnospiraceae bacterium]
MKNKTWKRVLATAMTAAVTTAALAGCGSSDSAESTSKSTEVAAEATADAAAEENTDFDKPDTWIADRTIVIQTYVNDIGYSLPEDIKNTPVMQELKKRTGIDLEIRYTPGDSDRAILSSQLAAGNIPDVICCYLNNSTRPEFPILLKAAKEGMFADLSDYMADSEVYSRYLEDDYLPADTYKNIVFREDFDGAVYLIHNGIDAEDTSTVFDPEDNYLGGMYIQQSIVDDLGIDPTSIDTEEKLYELLVQIKEKGYKDDNGNDMWPLGPKYWGGSVDALDNLWGSLDWGVSDGYNMDENGDIWHEAETDYVYEKIDYVRKLLNENLMNPEYFTMDSTRAEELVKTHGCAIIGDVHAYVDAIYDSEDWIPLGPLKDITGSAAITTKGKSGYGAFAISAEAENPEEIFAFFDYLSTYEGQLLVQYGIEGLSYNMVDGYPVLTDEVQEKLDNGDDEWLINNIGAAFGGSAVYFYDFMLTNLDNKNNFGESRPGAGAENSYARAVELCTEYPREYRKVEGMDASAYLAAEELADVKVQMDLLDYDDMLVQAFFAKDDAEVTAIVESFRAQLKAAGVEQFEDYLEELYAEDPAAIYVEK